ncbi:metalloendopeptidase [Agaricicola taiwanensis]|uniref:Metalloendopeptidase n=1 Tax=Agaricicola taiwanensis TaxID=591372 RepID=A0A8J2VL93_9RHOB|nr:M48 family metallopeptidase [Agaricicola taiwanensis]GGE35892.1 metalloendopeptidase [Agaricicola taiwanensis]
MRGAAVFFDGETSARQAIGIEVGPEHLRLRGVADALIADWPWSKVEVISDDAGMLRLRHADGPELARLEVADEELSSAIRQAADFSSRRVRDSRSARRIALWSGAAIISLAFTGLFGIPLAAGIIVPALPLSVDEALGRSVDGNIRRLLEEGEGGDCGAGPEGAAGRQALDKLVARLEGSANLPFPLKVAVVRNNMVNAFATSGGYVYLMQGFIDEAETPEEVAGVLAHEIGHIAARDGTRRVIETTGTSFLFGTVFGDLTGGGALAVGAQVLAESAHSRETERQADAFALNLMTSTSVSPAGLADFFRREARSSSDERFAILSSHPVSSERLEAIERAATAGENQPILTEDEWAALKEICGDD